MRSSYRCGVVAAGVLVAVGLAGPAAADPPRSGSCPTPFTAVGQAQLARAIELAGAAPQAAAEGATGAFALIDKNGDRVLCYHPIGKKEYVNVIDNVVPGDR
jgi:hypothetical protein